VRSGPGFCKDSDKGTVGDRNPASAQMRRENIARQLSRGTYNLILESSSFGSKSKNRFTGDALSRG